MTYTTAANPDILIRSDASTPLPNNAIAAGSWPMNGKPGPSIWINLDYDYNKPFQDFRRYTIWCMSWDIALV